MFSVCVRMNEWMCVFFISSYPSIYDKEETKQNSLRQTTTTTTNELIKLNLEIVQISKKYFDKLNYKNIKQINEMDKL